MNTVRTMARRQSQGAEWLMLRLAGACLLLATAGIHLDLYLTGYRTIPTIGPLFLFQVIAAFLMAALVLATPSRLVAAAGALLALATLGGYLLTVQFGLFGFREVRTTAGIAAGIIEVAGFVVLALYAAGSASASASAAPAAAAHDTARHARPASAALPRVGWRQAAVGTAVVAVVAFGLLGGALAGAGNPGTASGSAGSASAGGGLRSAKIGGATVLTNAAGRTLYWFAPDTPTKSVCSGSCATYWPPVRGPLSLATGVPGQLSTIKRADGTTQETYDGHPLYTYVGDSGPGQDHGNNLNLNGGLWHVVIVASH